MKKLLALLMVVVLMFTFVACGDSTDTGESETPESGEEVSGESDTPESGEEESSETDELDEDNEEENVDDSVGKVFESEVGKRTIIKSNKGIDLVQESGPFTIKLTDIQISDFEPSEYDKERFDGKDRLTVITMALEVENKSEDTNSIYPDQGTVVTDTKEQASIDIWLSNDVGGDFMGNIIKEGEVFAFLDSEAESINNIKYIIGAPHDEDFESLGEDITFEINF